MAHELPAKLRITLELLGCNSRKELCARFRDTNPLTEFDLERSHKWMQGRAKPRSARVYEDWARLLGTQRPGSWLLACTLDAFVDEVCSLFAADAQELRRSAGLHGQSTPADSTAGAAVHYLCGTYAAYSHAWSPYFEDQPIRGSLSVEPGRRARFLVQYREALPPGPVSLTGAASLVGRMLHVELHEAGSGAPLDITAFLPGRPASVLCGIASGATLMGSDPLPSATRIVLVRVPAAIAGQLHNSNRYLPLTPAALSAELGTLGIVPTEPVAAAAELCSFLAEGSHSGLNQVRHGAQARLARLFDRTTEADMSEIAGAIGTAALARI